jgi:hypothetical protein
MRKNFVRTRILATYRIATRGLHNRICLCCIKFCLLVYLRLGLWFSS